MKEECGCEQPTMEPNENGMTVKRIMCLAHAKEYAAKHYPEELPKLENL
jgi:hypothetical protein